MSDVEKTNDPSPETKYKVFVDDNYHYMDSEHRYGCGEFDTYEEAVVYCKSIVDEFLVPNAKGMSAEALMRDYQSYGEDPFISPVPEEGEPFSAWSYAKKRCKELCG